ncbi:hypothetical protein BD413DRAFT_606510 [Trametes elegans]|nr:hypothetical protein BD413DRAFT_606510 [Trametes elegans]
MLFTKNVTAAAALCLGLVLQAQAHAVISPALGIQGNPVRNDAQRPSKGKECGNVDIAKDFASSTAVQADANGTFAVTITNFNGGIDGSRQVTAQVDPSGTGKSFVSADVLQNGDKNPNGTGSQQLVAQLPSGTKCSGPGDKCLVAFVTAGGFGNCLVVQQAGDAASSSSRSSDANAAYTAASTSSIVDTMAAAATASKAVSSAAEKATASASASESSARAAKTQSIDEIRKKLLKDLEELEKELEQKGADQALASRTVRFAKDV